MRRFLPLWSQLFCAGLCLLASKPVAAQTGVVWLCALSAELTRIVCVADPDSVEDGTAAATTAVVRGTRFPLDPKQIYTVDLWSPSTDADAVETLARATICYRSPGCQVQFTAPQLQVALLRRR